MKQRPLLFGCLSALRRFLSPSLAYLLLLPAAVMSRGFYSKHFVSQDRCFFFNPETGLSSWSPPVDGIVL